jgi:hypothetical protein
MGIFAAIGKIIIESKDALEHLAKAITSYQESESNKRKERAQTELKAVVSLPVEVTAYYSSEQIERPVKNRREQIRLGLEGCGLLIAVALAGITLGTLLIIHGQLREMRRQTRQSLESFRIDERASIGIESMKLKYAVPFPPRTGVGYEVTAKNFGKTVAWDIVLRRVTAMDANTDEAIKHRMIQNALRDIPPMDAFPKSLGPSIPIVIPFTVGGSSPQTYGEGAKQSIWHDYLIGRIDYRDAFGIPHWMTFCFVITDAKGNIGYCETGNDEDRNSELPAN